MQQYCRQLNEKKEKTFEEDVQFNWRGVFIKSLHCCSGSSVFGKWAPTYLFGGWRPIPTVQTWALHLALHLAAQN